MTNKLIIIYNSRNESNAKKNLEKTLYDKIISGGGKSLWRL